MTKDEVRTQLQEYRITVNAILKSYDLPAGLVTELRAARESLVAAIDHMNDEAKDDEFDDDGHDCIEEVESMPGHYVIVAVGMIEQERVEKLIESLKYAHYEPASI